METFNNFISLHQILYPNEKYNILNITDESLTVNYICNDSQIIILYIYNSKTNNLNINLKSNSIISNHINRLLINHNLLLIQYNTNNITEFLFELNELLNEYLNYCTICGMELKLKGLINISCCSNSKCICKSYETVMDDKITTTYKHDPNVFSFLLEILIIGSQHSKGELAFKPIPMISNITNLNEFKNLIKNEYNNIEKNKLIKLIEESTNDLELINKINPQIYAILKNAISNNYFSMSSRDNIMISNSISSISKTNNKIKENNSIKFIHINYSAEIENKFPQKYFLFHGSNLSSWYSIIKNGLKVMSGTAMMANGAAFGHGIYFSDSFQMSLGYSGATNSMNGYGMQNIVGVFEILEDPHKWKKSSGIYVINDENILLLRTLVLLSPNTIPPKDISNYFLKEIPMQKQTNKLNVGILKNKRLEGEHKKLSALEFIDSIDIQNQWNIQFKKIKNDVIKLEIIFSNYPINPPIIKLLNSDIKIDGLISLDKTIMIDSLNPINWKITYNLAEIISRIYKCFQESL